MDEHQPTRKCGLITQYTTSGAMYKKLKQVFTRHKELLSILFLLFLLGYITNLKKAKNEANVQVDEDQGNWDVVADPLHPLSSHKLPRERVEGDGARHANADDDANAFVKGKPRKVPAKVPAKVVPVAPPEGSEEKGKEDGRVGISDVGAKQPLEPPSNADDDIAALGENGKPKKIVQPKKTMKNPQAMKTMKPKTKAVITNDKAAKKISNNKGGEDALVPNPGAQKATGLGVKAESFKRNCSAVENIYMLKVHKSGSTTLQNILWRWGFERNLRMMIFPKGFPYPHKPYHESYAPPTDPDFKGLHNIMCEHSIYHPPAIQATMPKNTKNIAILREPLSQLRSAAEFYGIVHQLVGVDRSVPTDQVLKTFLLNPMKYEKNVVPSDMIKVRNHVVNMFGYDDWLNVDNPAVFDKFMRQKDYEFFVLILERMEESLVLFRREMCWGFKQILTMPMRMARTKGEDDEEDSIEDLEMEYRDYNPGDYGVYDFFIRKIGYRIDDIVDKDDFWAEVKWFKNIQGLTQSFCEGICKELKGIEDRDELQKRLTKNITFAASAWDGSFHVDGSDCLLMMFDPYVFRNAVKVKNYPQLCNPDHGGPDMDSRWTIPTAYCEKDYFKCTIPWDVITNPKSYVHSCL